MRLLLAGALAVLALAFAHPSEAANFDCGKAKTPVEYLVCGNSNLSKLDDMVGLAYSQVKRMFGPEQYKWLVTNFIGMRRRCDTREACIATAYEQSLEAYNTLGAKVPISSMEPYLDRVGAEPRHVGQCVTTTVDRPGTRLEGSDPESGISLLLANGGYQVTYTDDPEVRKWEAGQQVMQCLVAVPQDCPAGDIRGKTFTVTNLTNMTSWTADDSEHQCGGA